ncbi:hypothetical protein SCALM49S_06582 [Streptomyces californicus]
MPDWALSRGISGEGARSGSAAEELAGWFKRSCMWVTTPLKDNGHRAVEPTAHT